MYKHIHTLGGVIEPREVDERVLEGHNDNKRQYEFFILVWKRLFSLFRYFNSSGDVVSAVWTVEIMSPHSYLLQQILCAFLVFYVCPRTSLSFFLHQLLFSICLHFIFGIRSIAVAVCSYRQYNKTGLNNILILPFNTFSIPSVQKNAVLLCNVSHSFLASSVAHCDNSVSQINVCNVHYSLLNPQPCKRNAI